MRTWQQEETQLKKRSAGNSAFARPSQGRPDDAEDDLAVMEDLGSSSAQVQGNGAARSTGRATAKSGSKVSVALFHRFIFAA